MMILIVLFNQPKGESTMPEMTINGKKYDADKLPDEAKKQLISIQFVERKLQELNLEQAALQTARNIYAKALNEVLQAEQPQ